MFLVKDKTFVLLFQEWLDLIIEEKLLFDALRISSLITALQIVGEILIVMIHVVGNMFK